MEAQEIIDARIAYERELWAIFGQTMLIIPDIAQARAAYNERTAPLRSR